MTPISLTQREPDRAKNVFDRLGVVLIPADAADCLWFEPGPMFVLSDSPESLHRDWHIDLFPTNGQIEAPEEVTCFQAVGPATDWGLTIALGSHTWAPQLTCEEVWAWLNDHGQSADYGWQRRAEEFTVAWYEDQVIKRGVSIIRPKLEPGDQLLWHPWTWHRSDADVHRPALITRFAEKNRGVAGTG